MTEENFSVYIETPIERTVLRLAGWQSGSCRGLQILVHRFNSGTGLQKCFTVLFRLSSAVEQSAVNRSVACSNQAAGAKKNPTLMVGFFWLLAICFKRRPKGACLEWIVGEHKFMPCEPYDTRRTRLREYPIWQPSLYFPP